jgi:hypothetical protein
MIRNKFLECLTGKMNAGLYLPVFGWLIDTALLNVELEQMSSSDPPTLCHHCYQVPTQFSARTTKKGHG